MQTAWHGASAGEVEEAIELTGLEIGAREPTGCGIGPWESTGRAGKVASAARSELPGAFAGAFAEESRAIGHAAAEGGERRGNGAKVRPGAGAEIEASPRRQSAPESAQARRSKPAGKPAAKTPEASRSNSAAAESTAEAAVESAAAVKPDGRRGWRQCTPAPRLNRK